MKLTLMTRTARLVATSLMALVLAGCAALQGGPRTVEISEVRLAELISGQFPFDNRYLELFDVTLAAPRLRLIPAENRIGTEFSFAMAAPLLGQRSMQGTLSLSYGLRFEPTDNTVRLAGVRVERLELPGVSQAYASRANVVGGLLTEKLLQNFVVHQLKPEDLQLATGLSYQPGALTVVPGGLQLQLNPVRR
jgi:hypothetical protein